MAIDSTFALTETEFDMVSHVIDIPDLEELKFSKCIIFKAPSNLRKVNPDAYTPQLISIGPIHFDNDKLKPMQERKKRYFHFFWKRVSNEQAMKNYKNYLEKKENEIRQCYAQNFADKEKFVDMMLVDAVFIMELLLRNSSWKSDTTGSFRKKHRDDDILAQSWLSKDIARDLILLENQIPFFVLNKLYETVVPDDNKKQEHTCFADLALEYYNGTLLGSMKRPEKNKDACNRPKHFTDLIRLFYLPTKHMGKFDRTDSFLRTATKLQEAGVRFDKVLDRRLLDVTYEKRRFLSLLFYLSCLPCLNHFKACFRVPQLKVDHTTECILRNLIAFEQCHYPEQPYICNYVSLIDSLIHTKDDVELLVEKEVIVHELGSDNEVATLVNGLCKHVVTNTTYYHELINDLDKHYQNIWNRTMATLWLVYFRDPWRASSTVVGIAVLVFAVFNFLRVMRYFL